jgi:hypothetical protein
MIPLSLRPRPTIATLLLLSVLLVPVARADAQAQSNDQEQQQGFVQLFNGKNLEGWKHAGNWKVDEGVITREGKGGSLVYQAAKVPDDFELRFEWKVDKGSNSGVYYRPTQYEYQILDNDVHKDGKNPRTSAASLYFCMPPSEDATNPVGQWNKGRIVCQGTVIQHWLNGKKVVGFDYTDPKWANEVELLRQRGGDLEKRGANLSLQDHGDPVWYRNLRWRALTSDEKIDRVPVVPQKLSQETLQAEREKLSGIIARRNAQKEKSQRESAAKKKRADN